jgi:predicted nucleotidyltransferase
MAAHNVQLTEKLQSLLAKRPEVLFAYLFGSRARGQAGPLSDTDVAVFINPSVDPFNARLVLIEELMRLIGDDRVDVVTLNNASPVLRQAVITDGVVVKEEKILRTSFEEQATCEYLDTAHLRATHDAAVKRRLAQQIT